MKPDPITLQLPGLEATKASRPLRTAGDPGMSAEEYRRRVAALPKGLKALSIKQPWAWLITRPDITDFDLRSQAFSLGLIKDFENRDWPPRHPGRTFKGQVLIHASLGPSKKKDALAEYDDAVRTAKRNGVTCVPSFESLERGGIVGMARIDYFADDMGDTDRDDFDSVWRFSSGFRLSSNEPLPFVPCKGMLGFFNPVFPEAK